MGCLLPWCEVGRFGLGLCLVVMSLGAWALGAWSDVVVASPASALFPASASFLLTMAAGGGMGGALLWLHRTPPPTVTVIVRCQACGRVGAAGGGMWGNFAVAAQDSTSNSDSDSEMPSLWEGWCLLWRWVGTDAAGTGQWRVCGKHCIAKQGKPSAASWQDLCNPLT